MIPKTQAAATNVQSILELNIGDLHTYADISVLVSIHPSAYDTNIFTLELLYCIACMQRDQVR